MAEARIEIATKEHALALAPLMRPEDAAEVRAYAGWTPLEALINSLEESAYARTLFLADEIAAMWGIAYFGEQTEVAVGWALTGRVAARYPKTFFATCKAELERMLKICPALINGIDARYTTSVGWADRLGFKVLDPIPFGVEGRPFHPVRIDREVARG